MKPAKHGRDHSLAGEDPFRPELPYVLGTRSGSGVITVTTNSVYLGIGTVKTNDPETFASMLLTNEQGNNTSISQGSIVILRRGVYRIVQHVRCDPATISDTASVESYVASSIPGSGLFGLSMNVGSHGGITSQRTITGFAENEVWWNVIDFHAGAGASFSTIAFKPYFTSSDASYDLEGWAISLTRISDAQLPDISGTGLPDGVTLT